MGFQLKPTKLLASAGGGFPGWLTNLDARARSGDQAYIDSFQQYIKEFSHITNKYQFPDGPVIGMQRLATPLYFFLLTVA